MSFFHEIRRLLSNLNAKGRDAMQRISFDDFVYEDDGTYTLNGSPFTGVACDYFADGTMRGEMQFNNGHQEGLAREWYENGPLKSEETYLGESLHGVSKTWYPNGKLKDQSVFEYAICVESKEWDEDGRLIREFHIQPTDPMYQYLEQMRLLWRGG